LRILVPEVPFIHILTNFGDQGLILPFILTVAVGLWLGEARREAFIWLAAAALSLGALLLLKLIFLPCGHVVPGLHLRSPSGHAAAGFAAFGGFAVLEARLRQDIRQKAAILILGFAFAAAIALSRLALDVHTVPEVVLGGLTGLIMPAILIWQVRGQTRSALAQPLLIALLLPVILMVVLGGTVLPIEEQIGSVAQRIAQAFGLCL
jgi:membrane-associated phospholipid phosphatase